MKKEIAEGLPQIELAEMLVEKVEGFEDYDPIEVSETWDRCDILYELENAGLFD